MRFRNLAYVAVILIVLLVFAVLFVPLGHRSTFRSVQDDEDSWGMRLVMSGDPGVRVSDEFAICNDELYLLIQVKYRTLLTVTYVRTKHWNHAEVQSLRSAHPELDPLWPDTTKPDLGVRWIDE